MGYNTHVSFWKATLTFADKSFSVVVRNKVSPAQADNVLTWDKEIMVVEQVVVLEVNFSKMLLAVIHERVLTPPPLTPFHVLSFRCAGMLECQSGIVILFSTRPGH